MSVTDWIAEWNLGYAPPSFTRRDLLRQCPIQIDWTMRAFTLQVNEWKTRAEFHHEVASCAWTHALDPASNRPWAPELLSLRCSANDSRCGRWLGAVYDTFDGPLLVGMDDRSGGLESPVGRLHHTLQKESLSLSSRDVAFVMREPSALQLINFEPIDDVDVHPPIALTCRRHGARILLAGDVRAALAAGKDALAV